MSLHAQNLQFRAYTTEDGLLTNTVNLIYQDKKGFIWIASSRALQRFDGRTFKVYRHDRNDPNLLRPDVKAIIEDVEGTLWVAAEGRLYTYSEQLDQFILFEATGPEPYGRNYWDRIELINDIYVQNERTLILATMRGSIIVDTQSHTWQEMPEVFPIKDDQIVHIHPDPEKRLWFQTYTGITRLDFETNEVLSFQHIEGKSGSLPGLILNLFITGDGSLWILGENTVYESPSRLEEGILYAFNPSEQEEDDLSNRIGEYAPAEPGKVWLGGVGELLLLDTVKKEILSRQVVDSKHPRSFNSIIVDKQGLLWTAMDRSGVHASYQFKPGIRRLIPGDTPDFVRLISQTGEDAQGNIWAGTDGSGLVRYDPVTEEFAYLNSKNSSLEWDAVVEIFRTRDDRMLVTTFPVGVYELDPQTRTLHEFEALKSYKWVMDLYEDEDGLIWFSTWGKMVSFNLKTGETQEYVEGKRQDWGTSANYITRWNDFLILTSWSKVVLFNLKTRAYEPYIWTSSPSPDDSALPHKMVFVTAVSPDNTLWLGTDDGLARYNESTETFDAFFEDHGLPGTSIRAMVFDDEGFLWLSTNNGIAKFDTETEETLLVLETEDGLQGREFNRYSAFKDSQGQLIFGGYNGFNIIDPDGLDKKWNIKNGQVFITGVFASRVNQEIIQNAEQHSDAIKLQTDVRVDTLSRPAEADSVSFRNVNFSFAYLDYLLPEKNTFSYRQP